MTTTALEPVPEHIMINVRRWVADLVAMRDDMERCRQLDRQLGSHGRYEWDCWDGTRSKRVIESQERLAYFFRKAHELGYSVPELQAELEVPERESYEPSIAALQWSR